MDYIFGIIVAVFVMAIAWSGRARSQGNAGFYSDIAIGVLYFVAFSIGSVIAGAVIKALLVFYACGSAWVGTILANGSAAAASVAAGLEYDKLAGVDFSFRVGANVLWGWALCSFACAFRIFSGRWPHQRRK